jgi:repressor LexA
MRELTERQKVVFEFIKSYVVDHGYPPTMREIGEHLGITWPAVRGHLAALERKGLVRINALKSRGIGIPGLWKGAARELPVAGRIRAGRPMPAIEEIESRIVVDKELFGEDDAFALRVTGDSMVEAGILSGDYVVVKPQPEVRSGEIGVVLIGEEATVKRVFLREGSITLMPENRSMVPVTYGIDEVSVIGRVIGVIRKI